ncbi:MAG: Glu/Leu/Phe/Val dehydrogenase dimerization domain-containing protein [Pseudomonadota bacterium]|jgi:Glutamate dehydrogenase/leucine dehydrogenase|nr:MAG: amino acid dehydrogenase [Pseudomonadota bacterium]
MNVFELPDFDDHEQVVFASDARTGLRAIVALHSTALGPAAGGCRMWRYASSGDAVADALRLSRGMSYKNAMADLPLGGGKAVIIGDPRRDKTPELLEAFGRVVESLGGRYVTAEDVGTTAADMEVISRVTRYVSGLHRRAGGAGGDPSPWTALGTFLGIRAAVKFKLGRQSLEGVSVAVQGTGGVGYHLCRLLTAEGARVRAADVRAEALDRVVSELGVTPVSAESILFEPVDVIAPCALGAVLNATSIPRLKAPIVAGAANNQLATADDGVRLHAAGVLYAPDYVINAGGIISVAREYLGGATEEQVKSEVHRIADRLLEIFERSRRENRPTSAVADQLARERLRAGERRLVA